MTTDAFRLHGSFAVRGSMSGLPDGLEWQVDDSFLSVFGGGYVLCKSVDLGLVELELWQLTSPSVDFAIRGFDGDDLCYVDARCGNLTMQLMLIAESPVTKNGKKGW